MFTISHDNVIFLLVTIFVAIPPTLGVIIAILIGLNNKKASKKYTLASIVG